MAPKRYFPVRRMEGHALCPGCGDGNEGKETMVTGVLQCTGCGGYIGKCYRGEAMALIDIDKPPVVLEDKSNCRFYHFTWIDTGEVVTGHFDRMSRRVVLKEAA